MVKTKRCSALLWLLLLPGWYACSIFCLDLIIFPYHCRTEEFYMNSHPYCYLSIWLFSYLALFSSSRKSKASIIKLAENGSGLRTVSFFVFNQGSVMCAGFLYSEPQSTANDHYVSQSIDTE